MKQRIQLISDTEMNKKALNYKIETGNISNTDFNAMTEEEQANTKNSLFGIYADKVLVPKSLSALEFLGFYTVKFMTKHMKGESLTAEEQAVFDRFASIISAHEIDITDINAYQLDYMTAQIANTQVNRDDYNANKLNITGDL